MKDGAVSPRQLATWVLVALTGAVLVTAGILVVDDLRLVVAGGVLAAGSDVLFLGIAIAGRRRAAAADVSRDRLSPDGVPAADVRSDRRRGPG